MTCNCRRAIHDCHDAPDCKVLEQMDASGDQNQRSLRLRMDTLLASTDSELSAHPDTVRRLLKDLRTLL